MKATKITIGLMLLGGLFMFSSCQDEKITPQTNDSIVPTSFSVNIPDAISYEQSTLKAGNDERINGQDVYKPLGYFIKIGEGASEIVQSIITHIAVYKINSLLAGKVEEIDKVKLPLKADKTEIVQLSTDIALSNITPEFTSNVGEIDKYGVLNTGSHITDILLLSP